MPLKLSNVCLHLGTHLVGYLHHNDEAQLHYFGLERADDTNDVGGCGVNRDTHLAVETLGECLRELGAQSGGNDAGHRFVEAVDF